MDSFINEITPEADRVPSVRNANCNPSVLNMHPQDILPSDKFNPLDILLSIEFIQLFH
jgi:hypothetical protein